MAITVSSWWLSTGNGGRCWRDFNAHRAREKTPTAPIHHYTWRRGRTTLINNNISPPSSMLQSEIVTSLMEAKLLKNWTWTIFSAFWCNMSDMILVLKIMMIMIIEYFQFGPRLGVGISPYFLQHSERCDCKKVRACQGIQANLIFILVEKWKG